MFAGDVTLVKKAELRAPKKGGEPFAVARGVIKRDEFRKEIGATVVRSTFVGLVAFGAGVDSLMGYEVGQVMRCTGELREDNFTGKDGQPASDLKLVLASITSRPTPTATEQEDAAYADLVAASEPVA